MERKFVQIEDIARKLHVSVSTVRTWIRQGHIPADTYIKVGKTYRFSENDVLDALVTAPKPVQVIPDEDGEGVNIDKMFASADEDY